MKRENKGFTLIELLVVIAIIAILAAILFPVFASAKDRAKAASCMNSMKQIAMAHTMYMDNNNDALVPVGLMGVGGGAVFNVAGALYWPDLLSKYTAKAGSIHKCPSAKYFGIGMNHPDLGRWLAANTRDEIVKSVNIKYASKTVVFADTALIADINAEPDDWKEKTNIDPSKSDPKFNIVFRTPNNDLFGSYYANPDSATRVVGRHTGLANCVFMDGHCSATKVSALGFKYQSDWSPSGYHDPRVLWDRF